MGKTKTPQNRIEVTDISGYGWQTAFEAKPTEANLKTWVETFNQSVISGHNAHLGNGAIVKTAKVVAQKGAKKGETLVSVTPEINFKV